jgi:type IV pilus assembly protein PilW
MKRVRGLTMIELLVSLAIGSFVIMGAVFVYQESRTTYALNEQVARLQENARYALAIIEPDVQLAGNYGASNNSSDIIWNATEIDATKMTPSSPAVLSAPAVHTCGNNFALYLQMPIEGTNNSYFSTACLPPVAAGAAVVTADTLTVRRALSEKATAATTRYVQFYTNKLLKSQQRVFWSNTAPSPGVIDYYHDIFNLTFRSYYIATNSSARANVPTLWRKVLGVDAAGTAPAVLDEEIMPGVEDMQIEFGVDNGDHNADGVLDADKEFPPNVPDYVNGMVSRWVAPNDPGLQPYPAGNQWQIVAVRLWLRLRSDTPDFKFDDGRTYTYAGVNYTPAGTARQFRRLLVSRTIYLRNARIF